MESYSLLSLAEKPLEPFHLSFIKFLERRNFILKQYDTYLDELDGSGGQGEENGDARWASVVAESIPNPFET